jgi:hypothetical protein
MRMSWASPALRRRKLCSRRWQTADFVFHLAGVNRPPDPVEFAAGNAGLTQGLCDALAAARYQLVVVFMLTAATAITATITVLLYRRSFFTPAAQLLPRAKNY